MPESSKRLLRYLSSLSGAEPNPATTACLASLDHVEATSPSVAAAIVAELRDQRSNLKLIASENYCSLAVQLAQGNWFTDKYAEGYPGHRFYAGCDNVDRVESEACALACSLFGAEHAYVQPHSGADANLVAFLAILAQTVQSKKLAELGEANPAKLTREQWNQVREALQNQRLLALDYYSGGHLTHGYRFNLSGMWFDAHSYSVDPASGLVDLDRVWAQARELKPRILLAGYSAYPRALNFAKMRQIADDVGATFMVDMAHFAGLVAGKVFTGDFDPVAHAHVVTSTTHKTLRGPRGGLVLCKKEFAEAVDKGCPAALGGPLPHAMCAKAVAFEEARRPEFQTYAAKIVENARALAAACISEKMEVLTGGTDNHLLLVDVSRSFGLTGRQAESALREAGVTLNRNSLPNDPNGPWYTSGLRLGTPATTTLGMGPTEMGEMASIIRMVLSRTEAVPGPAGAKSQAKYKTQDGVADEAKARVRALLSHYPLYPELGEL
jgi:glycine hydroxymethyltransferase